MGLGGASSTGLRRRRVKLLRSLAGAGEHHVVQGVVTQQTAQRGKHQAGVTRFAAGKIAHFDDAVAGRTDPETGLDGGLDRLLQILLQIERLLVLAMAGLVSRRHRPARHLPGRARAGRAENGECGR